MDVSLNAETGRPLGSRASGRLRAAGKVPGVVYGLGSETVAVTVDWPELRRALTTESGLNALIDLSIDGTSNLSVVKDLQRDPIRRIVRHVDFMLIDRDEPLVVDVPLTLVGEAPALEAMKGMIDQLVYHLTVRAKPGSIPTQIEVDVSGLDLGTSVHVGEVPLPPGVSTEMDPELPVAQGSATRLTLMLQQGLEPGDVGYDDGTGASAGDAGDATATEPAEQSE